MRGIESVGEPAGGLPSFLANNKKRAVEKWGIGAKAPKKMQVGFLHLFVFSPTLQRPCALAQGRNVGTIIPQISDKALPLRYRCKGFVDSPRLHFFPPFPLGRRKAVNLLTGNLYKTISVTDISAFFHPSRKNKMTANSRHYGANRCFSQLMKSRSAS